MSSRLSALLLVLVTPACALKISGLPAIGVPGASAGAPSARSAEAPGPRAARPAAAPASESSTGKKPAASRFAAMSDEEIAKVGVQAIFGELHHVELGPKGSAGWPVARAVAICPAVSIS